MDVIIEELGPRGDGIFKGERGRIYVERSVPGDSLEIKTRRGSDGVTHGDIVKIISPSEDRAEPPCEYYDVCGGCTLQHLRGDFYKNWKQGLVREALERQNVTVGAFLEPVFIDAASRRRVTFSALKQRKGIIVGYNKRRSKFINNIERCLVADPEIMNLRPALIELLAPVLQEGRVVDVLIQHVGGVFDVVLTGKVGKKGSPDLSVMQMAADLIQTTKVARVSWRADFHDDLEIIVEKEPVRISFGVLDVQLPAASFLQPTLAGEQALVGAVMKLLPKRGHFADLYSGCGTFAGAMLGRGSVDAFETNGNAIAAMDRAGKRQGLKLRALKRDLFREPLTMDEVGGYDALVFDPPRGGANKQVANLARSNVKKIIGVSCNPATFARDARVLTEGGYHLDSVQIFDQFTWSHHVEVVGCFSKQV